MRILKHKLVLKTSPTIHTAQTKNIGMSLSSIFSNFLSVSRIAIRIGMIAIENLKNSRVVESIPFWVNVRTNIPLDPNIRPARIGKTK